MSKRTKQPTFDTPNERLRHAFNKLLAWSMTVDTEQVGWHAQCVADVEEIQSAKREVDDANARKAATCDTASS